jgi:hypothetical protein
MAKHASGLAARSALGLPKAPSRLFIWSIWRGFPPAEHSQSVLEVARGPCQICWISIHVLAFLSGCVRYGSRRWRSWTRDTLLDDVVSQNPAERSSHTTRARGYAVQRWCGKRTVGSVEPCGTGGAITNGLFSGACRCTLLNYTAYDGSGPQPLTGLLSNASRDARPNAQQTSSGRG